MKTREDYDKIINDLKDKLGEDFSKVSDIVADLSTDYDSVIQQDNQYKQDIANLQGEKIQLLETNNKLFTQVTSKSPEHQDPIFKQEEKKQEENNANNIKIDDVINEKGGLD